MIGISLPQLAQPHQILLHEQVQRLDRHQHRNKLIEAAGDLIEQAQFDLVQVSSYPLLRFLQLAPFSAEQFSIHRIFRTALFEVPLGYVFVAFLHQLHVD